MKFTVFGDKGFIGRNLTKHLLHKGYDVNRISRDNFVTSTESLGNVFYCIGMTANFRSQPYATIDAHVCLLKKILETSTFDSFTYLSSTRIYQGAKDTHEEAPLEVLPIKLDYIYNISKIMGESLCINSNANVKIVRLSNVFGEDMPPDTFLSRILSDAVNKKNVEFLTSAISAKDYVSIEDVVRWLPQIAIHGKHTIYNVASGKNTSNQEISAALKSIGVNITFQSNAPTLTFKEIYTSRLHEEFDSPRKSLESSILSLINSIKAQRN